MSTCGRPAVYRLDGRLTYLGGCDGNLGDPPAEITVGVGATFDLHMTAEVLGGQPMYPLPTTTDPGIVRPIAAQDAGTATFQAVGPGTAVLLTTGNCSGSGASPAFVGPCPVLQVDVTAPTPIAPPTAVASLPPTAAWYRFESAAMSEGNRLLTLQFYGGLPYDPSDPCSVAYAGWAQPDGPDLVAAVINVTPVPAPPAPTSSPVACPAFAVERTVTVPLAQPFLGARVRDLAGGASFVRRPDGLEVLHGLPPGWSLRSEGDVAESQTGRWLRMYAPVPKPDLTTSLGHLDFYESFGSQVAISCGGIGTEQTVQVNGKEAHLSLCGVDDELILEWPVGANDLALDANAADFSIGALIKLAEGAAPG